MTFAVNGNPVPYFPCMRPVINRMNVNLNITTLKLNCVFNQYKNSIGIIKIILMSDQMIGGKLNDQPRIGDSILVNSLNLSWS